MGYSLEEKQKIINDWREAYRKINEKEPPKIQFNGPWIQIETSKYRLSDLIVMTERLNRRRNK